MRLRRMIPLVVGLVATTHLALAGVAIGEKLDPFRLKDAAGKDVDLAGYKDKKALVLIFMATQCPVSNAYNTRMAAIAQDYKEKGVAVVGINSNRQENAEEVLAHAQKYGLSFPILKDWNNVYADRYGASVTPETYVYDSSMILRYHGRIDDSRPGDHITSQDLRTALDSVLSGKAVANPETKAFGCTIKRVEK